MSEAYALEEEKKFTYADYKAWELKPGERFELINGVAYAMAAPGSLHQEILMGLASQIYVFLRGKPCKVYPSPYDVRLFYEEDESDDTVVQPDIVVVCDAMKRASEGCRGAPDLVVEILSPSNTAIEMERKFNLYKKAGIKEYWIIDPENKGLRVCCFRNDEVLTSVYGNSGAAPVSILPGLEIKLDEVFAG